MPGTPGSQKVPGGPGEPGVLAFNLSVELYAERVVELFVLEIIRQG